ncbi:MAG: hypothetical protein ACXVJT_04880 [Thermoanaerobaculia bacterium]
MRWNFESPLLLDGRQLIHQQLPVPISVHPEVCAAVEPEGGLAALSAGRIDTLGSASVATPSRTSIAGKRVREPIRIVMNETGRRLGGPLFSDD